ncbi:uncharacterized protein LOC142171798 [Nicotiana tabacum]|uniref:Uncharacterized protein LOC142171798 n=1 Tax=Nicotiana tabacum TaxID=4097 RepID=A0AC58T2Z4_TOBAC
MTLAYPSLGKIRYCVACGYGGAGELEAFHQVVPLRHSLLPMIDGQTERTIQTLEDMLRASVLDFKGSWEDHLPLIEFAYNNNYHSSIQMAPYEALYGRKCRSPVGWFKVGETKLLGPNLVQQAVEKVKMIQSRLFVAQSRQKSYSNNQCRDLEFSIEDWILLKVSPMENMTRFGKKGKLSPHIRLFRESAEWLISLSFS